MVTTAFTRMLCAANCAQSRATSSPKRHCNVRRASLQRWDTSMQRRLVPMFVPTTKTERWTSTGTWSRRATTKLSSHWVGDRRALSVKSASSSTTSPCATSLARTRSAADCCPLAMARHYRWAHKPMVSTINRTTPVTQRLGLAANVRCNSTSACSTLSKLA